MTNVKANSTKHTCNSCDLLSDIINVDFHVRCCSIMISRNLVWRCDGGCSEMFISSKIGAKSFGDGSQDIFKYFHSAKCWITQPVMLSGQKLLKHWCTDSVTDIIFSIVCKIYFVWFYESFEGNNKWPQYFKIGVKMFTVTLQQNQPKADLHLILRSSRVNCLSKPIATENY